MTKHRQNIFITVIFSAYKLKITYPSYIMRTIFTLPCFVAVSTVNGQDSLQRASDTDKIQFLTSKYTRVLSLNDTQKSDFAALVEARSTEINTTRVNRANIDYQVINTEYREKLKTVLNEEQYQLYTTLIQEKQKGKA